jgi:hypothetical protein
MIKRLLRGLIGQAFFLAPDVINWIAGTALPVIPPPWNVILGLILNTVGKGLRDYGPQAKTPDGVKPKYSWVPV